MTAKQLAPDTAREISGLKRRVSDLERLLDRVRRDLHRPVPSVPAGFAAIYGTGIGGAVHTVADGWSQSRPTNPINATVTDPTGRLIIDRVDGPFGDWTLRTISEGIYLFGVTVTFGDPDERRGDRRVAVQRIDFEGPSTTHDLTVVPGAGDPSVGGTATTLTAVAAIHSGAGFGWRPMFADRLTTPLQATVVRFWGLHVTDILPVPVYIGS